MSFAERHKIVWFPVACLAICLMLNDGHGQDPNGMPDPSGQVVEKIRQALEGGAEIQESGDAVLDELIQIIQKRGSILDGSLLDRKTRSNGPPDAPQRREATPDLRIDSVRVAELLLKTARLLEQVEPVDETRQDLVNQMRRETVRLLSK